MEGQTGWYGRPNTPTIGNNTKPPSSNVGSGAYVSLGLPVLRLFFFPRDGPMYQIN